MVIVHGYVNLPEGRPWKSPFSSGNMWKPIFQAPSGVYVNLLSGKRLLSNIAHLQLIYLLNMVGFPRTVGLPEGKRWTWSNASKLFLLFGETFRRFQNICLLSMAKYRVWRYESFMFLHSIGVSRMSRVMDGANYCKQFFFSVRYISSRKFTEQIFFWGRESNSHCSGCNPCLELLYLKLAMTWVSGWHICLHLPHNYGSVL